MRFFAVFTPLVVAIASFAAAQSKANPILYPYSSTTLHAGDTINIKWDPTTQGTISLQLREGPYNDLDEGIPIASGLPNTGSYKWMIPSTTKYSAYYTVQITSDSDPSEVNYSSQFPIQSTNMAASLSHASASMGISTISTPSMATHDPTLTRMPRPTRSSSTVVLLSSTAAQGVSTHIPTGAAQPQNVRGGVAAALAVGAGIAFAL